MSNKRTLTDIAYEVLSEGKTAVAFGELWKSVIARNEGKGGDISQFYADLLLDGRFINLKGNLWDLRSNHTFAESYINLEELDIEDEEEESRYDEEEDENESANEEEE